MKPTAPLAAILLSITLAPAHALVIHPDIWFSSDNGNIQCGGYSQYGSGVVCEIYQRTDNIQPRTARPEACQKRDWGYRFALDDRGEARTFCVDDKLRNLSATPLANGATQRRKNMYHNGTREPFALQQTIAVAMLTCIGSVLIVGVFALPRQPEKGELK